MYVFLVVMNKLSSEIHFMAFVFLLKERAPSARQHTSQIQIQIQHSFYCKTREYVVLTYGTKLACVPNLPWLRPDNGSMIFVMCRFYSTIFPNVRFATLVGYSLTFSMLGVVIVAKKTYKTTSLAGGKVSCYCDIQKSEQYIWEVKAWC